MALKKPSEFFNGSNSIPALEYNAGINFGENSQKVETVSEAFNSFKSNLEKIDALTDFTETFDKFKDNVEKVSILSEEIDYIHAYIKTLLNKEDLENAMMSHLIVVEQNIQQLQSNVKSINSKTLVKIKEDFSDLSERVEDFIDIEVPKYKKLIKDSEIRVENKINVIDSALEEKVDNLDQYLQERINSIESFVDGINQESLFEFENKINLLSSEVNSLVKVEIPKYKKIIAESRLKNEEGINLLTEKLDTELSNHGKIFEDKISKINQAVDSFMKEELPKYGSMLVDTKINFENDLKEYKENISLEIFSSLEKIKIIKEEIEENNLKESNIVQEKIIKLESDISLSLENIDSIGERYKRLFEDFKNREIYNDEKLQLYSESLDKFSEKVSNLENNLDEGLCEVQKNIDINSSKYYDVLKKEVGFFEQNISDKLKDLEINFIRNESHIQSIREETQDVISRLKINDIEDKNKQLVERINHLEKILKEFDEKNILQEEGSLLTGSEKLKTSDPLTPLDKKFVTFDDLSSHYRNFINRIQIQLASIGGGGAGFIKDLDDVDFDQTTGNGKLLIYDQTNSKWVGIASTSLSAGSSTLVGLSDVDSTNLGDGRFLRYNASTSEFTFSPVSASNLELIAGDIQSGILTTNSTGAAVVMSISASIYRSANYQIQVSEGSNFNMTTINVIHDGTNTYMSEYGTINQPIGIATFSTDISGGSLRLLGYPSFASETTFKVIFTAIEA